MLTNLLTLDGQILIWIQEILRIPILDAFFCFYTTLGNAGIGWITLSILFLVHPKTRAYGIVGLGAMLCGYVCTNLILKPLIDRSRPWLVVEGLTYLVEEHDPHSFPSGHSCAAFAAGISWCLLTQREWLKLLCVGQAVLMAFSRLYVGVHYPSDVIVGSVIGTLAAYFTMYLYHKWLRRKEGLHR